MSVVSCDTMQGIVMDYSIWVTVLTMRPLMFFFASLMPFLAWQPYMKEVKEEKKQ